MFLKISGGNCPVAHPIVAGLQRSTKVQIAAIYPLDFKINKHQPVVGHAQWPFHGRAHKYRTGNHDRRRVDNNRVRNALTSDLDLQRNDFPKGRRSTRSSVLKSGG